MRPKRYKGPRPFNPVFLGREEILRLVREGKIVIDPFDPSAVGPASVDLSLGNVFRVFRGGGTVDVFDDSFDPAPYGEIVEIPDSSTIALEPGAFVLGITRERIALPENIMGFLSGRSRFARIGLMVHVSSSIVHPGSDNRQVLEIVNVGPYTIRLRPGVRICQIAFSYVEGGEPLRDRYARQRSP